MGLIFEVSIIIFSLSAVVQADNGCRVLKYQDCIPNKALTGHVIKSSKVMVPGLQICQNMCFNEGKCVSYNLSPVEGHSRTCELNGADHWMVSSALVAKTGYEFCPIENECSSKLCSGNKPMCHPDFAWDTFTCREGLWSSWSSWSYCDCPVAKRSRRCVSNTLSNPTDCGPGKAEETKECPKAANAQCSKALGMQDGRISDSQITSSGDHDRFCLAKFGRLHSKYRIDNIDGAWCALNAAGSYLQVDLLQIMTITKIATQGRLIVRNSKQYVTSYSISYNNDTDQWHEFPGGCPVKKIFSGNIDTTSVVTNDLIPPIKARLVRVYPVTFHAHPSMRMELYGC